jgi:hypothetical protein
MAARILLALSGILHREGAYVSQAKRISMGFVQFLPAAMGSAQHRAKRVTTVQETVLLNLSVIIMDSAKIPLVNKLAHATIVIRQTPYAMAMESVK